MNRRQFLVATPAVTAGIAGCLGSASSSEVVYPRQKFITAIDPDQSPPQQIDVLSRIERADGAFEYAIGPGSPLRRGDDTDGSFADEQLTDGPLVVPDSFHDRLTDRFDDVQYSTHVRRDADGPDSDDESSYRGYVVTKDDFKAFTLADAVVLGDAAAGDAHPIRDVREGDGR